MDWYSGCNYHLCPFTYTCIILGVWEYIEATRDLVRDLERRVRLAKANVDNICTIMAGWCKTPLYKRKGDKKESLLNLEVSVQSYIY